MKINLSILLILTMIVSSYGQTFGSSVLTSLDLGNENSERLHDVQSSNAEILSEDDIVQGVGNMRKDYPMRACSSHL